MPDDAYTIRPGVAEDAPTVAKLWSMMAEQHRRYDAEVWCWAEDAADSWRGKYREFVAGDDMITPVARTAAGKLVGYAVACAKDSSPMFATRRTGEVWDLLVAPAHRNRGLAGRLMTEVFEQLRSRGAEDVTLHAAIANAPAIGFYEKLGFQRVMYRMYRRLGDEGGRRGGPAGAAAGCAVRPARPEDADAAAEMMDTLVEQARSYPGRMWAAQDEIVAYWRERFAGELDEDDMIAMVAEDRAGRPVGFVEAKATDSEEIFATSRIGEVWNIFVRRGHRGRGIGRRLMENVFRRQRAKGCDDVVIHVDLGNGPAFEFYRTLGLRAVMYRMYRRL